jgi:hypothetical protein
MDKSSFLEIERKFAAEKLLKYKGTASISIDVLHFGELDKENVERKLNKKYIERLQESFQEENGCRRLDPRNRALALINESDLNAALAASGKNALPLYTSDCYPVLDFPPGFLLNCFHGYDTAIAGTASLPPDDRRWTVDLFLTGMC